MVKKTLEAYECDRCGDPATRYSMAFEEGETLLMDRCPKHNKKLEALRDEPGEWVTPGGRKSTFKKSSPMDIQLAIARRQNGKE